MASEAKRCLFPHCGKQSGHDGLHDDALDTAYAPAERGATPGGPDGGMETPEALVERMWSTPGYADEVAIAAIRARDEEWTLRVQQAHAQGWAEGRDAAAVRMRALCDKHEGKLFCDGIAGENCRWVSELRGLKPKAGAK